MSLAAPTSPQKNASAPRDRLPRRLVLAYGTGQAAEGATNYLLTTLLLFYYTSILGLSGELAGLALLIGLVFDAVTDPLIAVASDHTRSRWGRRHPYMLASALPLGAGLILAFRPPDFVAGQTALFLWLLVMAILIRAALTLFHVPHMALGAELSGDYDERTRVVTARAAAGMVGSAIVVILYYSLLGVYESPDYPDVRLNPLPYELHSLIVGLLAGCLVLIPVFGTRRVIPMLAAPGSSAQTGSLFARVLRDMAATLRIPAFRVLVIGLTVCSLSWGFASAMQTHLALYFWHVSMELQAVGGFSLMIGMVIGMGFWKRFAERRDKKPALVLGMLWYTAFSSGAPILKVLGLFPAEGTLAYVVAYAGTSCLVAFGIASLMVLSGSMMADITDEDELASGLRREGIFFGAHSFATKVAYGLGVATGGVLYDWVGLTQGMAPADAPASAGPQLGLTSGLLIAIMVGAGTLAFLRYNLDRERHAATRAALAARRPTAD